jgi:outer membrane protein assembly factor BamB
VLGTCGNGAGNNSLVAIRPGDGKDIKPEIAYKIDKTSAPYVPSIVAKGNLVFLWSDQGIATCIDGATAKIHWRERIGGSYFGSPVRVANRIYGISTDGEVVVLDASEKFKIISRAKLDDVCRSTPAVAGGKLYLRTQSHLFSLGGKSATQ